MCVENNKIFQTVYQKCRVFPRNIEMRIRFKQHFFPLCPCQIQYLGEIPEICVCVEDFIDNINTSQTMFQKCRVFPRNIQMRIRFKQHFFSFCACHHTYFGEIPEFFWVPIKCALKIQKHSKPCAKHFGYFPEIFRWEYDSNNIPFLCVLAKFNISGKYPKFLSVLRMFIDNIFYLPNHVPKMSGISPKYLDDMHATFPIFVYLPPKIFWGNSYPKFLSVLMTMIRSKKCWGMVVL